jgi:hypothetical protein
MRKEPNSIQKTNVHIRNFDKKVLSNWILSALVGSLIYGMVVSYEEDLYISFELGWQDYIYYIILFSLFSLFFLFLPLVVGVYLILNLKIVAKKQVALNLLIGLTFFIGLLGAVFVDKSSLLDAFILTLSYLFPILILYNKASKLDVPDARVRIRYVSKR